jgi:Spy/CpxP family protein refolding chaperone
MPAMAQLPPVAPAVALPAEELQMAVPAQGPTPAVAPAPKPRVDLGKWWKNSHVVQELQLTETQINQLEQTFLDHRLKLIDLRADVERQETRLQPLLEADQPDEAKVSAQLDQVLAARGKLEKANAMMMLSIRRVLTVEQWKRLNEIQHGHGMFHKEPLMPAKRPMPGQQPRTPPPPRPPDSEN